MSGTNGTSVRALAAEKLRELPLKPAEAAAVARLETQSLYYTDQRLIKSLADEMTPANRRQVEEALQASHYHPIPDKRPSVPPELLQRIAEAAAIVEARRLVADAAQDAWILKALAVRTARDSDEVERRRAEVRIADVAYQRAHEAHKQGLGALTDLYVERDNRARAALLSESTK